MTPHFSSGARRTLRACMTALLLAASALSAPAARADANPAATPQQLDKLRRADGAHIVPEKFLHSWDPVTIFFDKDTGPLGGGPEDHPEKFVAMKPAAPGAWQWLGPRALQFRPADFWKPLENVEFTAEGRTTKLTTLLLAPESSSPAGRSDGVTDLSEVTLTFESPVDVEALARLMSIELRPSPGLDASAGQPLGPQDFTIEALERAKLSDKASYAVKLRQAVPDGKVLALRLKLAGEPGLDVPIYELKIKSAAPFHVTDVTCGEGFDRDAADGVLRCSPYGGYSSGGEGSSGSAAASPRRRLAVSFSARPEALDAMRARGALRLTPPVDDLAVEPDGSRLKLSGRFLADTVYRLRIEPGSMMDERKRPLEGAAYVQRFAFEADKPSVRWDAAQGVVERFGPQFVPVRGRGFEKADVRIHAIDPLSRDFWPFPARGVETDDEQEPPLPGAEPQPWKLQSDVQEQAIIDRIKALGSPAVSELMSLPVKAGGVEAKFGLDLKPYFAKIAGPSQPGAYLVGLRPTSGGKRRWMRAQVTDLSLSAVEEAARVHFAVTSLSTARPVEGARIQLQGLKDDKFVSLVEGVTGADGSFTWAVDRSAGGPALAGNRKPEAVIKRVIVAKGADVLVVEPGRAPSEYSHGIWSKPGAEWLAWAFDPKRDRVEKPRVLCHVFTERPIYRPEEAVQIKGYVRRYLGGKLTFASGGGTMVVTGPGRQEWRVPVKLDARGGFYRKFDAQTPATGDYTVRFEPDGARKTGDQETAGNESCGAFPFKKEAYRLPTFEVLLNSPQQAPLDGQFNVDLLARYFAGGLVAERPIKWRAAQFPYAWTPPGREGFMFSTDSRFSGGARFRSSPVLEREGRTDAGGAARIAFDATIEPTAQPRRYVVEATVTGDDDIQVRSVQNVIALPPFVLGVKAPRYVAKPGVIEPELLAVNGNGEPMEGVEMTVRFIRRNWTSVLQASDFSQGAAKYVTQVIDETLVERKVTSAKEALRQTFEARESGVYLVQVEATDRIGRRQQVSVDMFVGGDRPVTWSKPPAQIAAVATDKDEYAPGETATLVIQSPFQSARALAVVEEPGGQFKYDWVEIANGYGRYPLTVRKEQLPRVAVHFLIMRGRLPGTAASPGAAFDQGKPVTIAATKWVTVKPVKNIVTARLEYPAKARPGQEVEVTLRLADDQGKPLSGEATFWLVDQAVLSLAKEQPLDPLPSFIVNRPTKMTARDTRNMAFGVIPLEENPGGGGGEREEWGGDNNISVRKNFTPVPVYLPSVQVGEDGVARVRFRLPDSLTVFKLRAKAISGPDRFGYATGEMRIRQELVAQPALPRFVRPGDSFEAGLIGRVVEGPGGTGKAAASFQGLTLSGAGEQNFAWEANKPARLAFPVSVDQPAPGKEKVKLRFGLTRDFDKAADNVEIELPVRPDRPPVRQYEIFDLAAGRGRTLTAPQQSVRPGSYERRLVLAADPSLVRLVGGLQYLIEYPYGCTEQRMSLASAALAVKPFAPLLAASGLEGRVSANVKDAVRAIRQSIDADGLVAFWPKSPGNVSLTAWAYSFLNEARKAGEPVDKALIDRLGAVLKQALRSDYPRFIGGEEIRERVEALTALAEGGSLEESYVAELARRASAMPNLTVAEMTAAAAGLPGQDRRLVASLAETMWGRVQFLSRNGRRVYAGLAGESVSPVILPSETRSLAEITRAAALASPSDPRLAVLTDGLMRLGEGDGWGSTNADAAAVRALATVWKKPSAGLPVTVTSSVGAETLTLDGDAPAWRRGFAQAGDVSLKNGGAAPVAVLSDVRYQPVEPGYKARPQARGFALSRQSFRAPAGGGPLEKLAPGADGAVSVKVGDVIEEVVEVVTSEDRTHVAITAPLAAGLEPLNPNLANAPAEAAPSAGPTLAPTWVSYGDDRVLYAYDTLPKGNYRFVFRTKALIPGSFTQPPAEAETMYKKGVYGASAGSRIVVTR